MRQNTKTGTKHFSWTHNEAKNIITFSFYEPIVPLIWVYYQATLEFCQNSCISGDTKKGGKYTLDQIEVESFRDSDEEGRRSRAFSDLSEPEVGLIILLLLVPSSPVNTKV